jgi:hypothetical protein
VTLVSLQAIDLARRRTDLHLMASDFSAAFVALTRRNAARAGTSGLYFAVADATDLGAVTGPLEAAPAPRPSLATRPAGLT